MNPIHMKLSMPFEVGAIRSTVYGGPFRNFQVGTRRLKGVKMAEEINTPTDIDIGTPDFAVPDPLDMRNGVREAIAAMADGYDLYVGCMGGTGRTGTFMGVLAKIMLDASTEKVLLIDDKEYRDPVLYVRASYKPHAIETPAQETFVRTYDTREALDWLKILQPGFRFEAQLAAAEHDTQQWKKKAEQLQGEQVTMMESVSARIDEVLTERDQAKERAQSLASEMQEVRLREDGLRVTSTMARQQIDRFETASTWLRIKMALAGKLI